jgi:hypothetical protein
MSLPGTGVLCRVPPRCVFVLSVWRIWSWLPTIPCTHTRTACCSVSGLSVLHASFHRTLDELMIFVGNMLQCINPCPSRFFFYTSSHTKEVASINFLVILGRLMFSVRSCCETIYAAYFWTNSSWTPEMCPVNSLVTMTYHNLPGRGDRSGEMHSVA